MSKNIVVTNIHNIHFYHASNESIDMHQKWINLYQIDRLVVTKPTLHKDYSISASRLLSSTRTLQSLSLGENFAVVLKLCSTSKDPIVCMSTIPYVCTLVWVAFSNLTSPGHCLNQPTLCNFQQLRDL